MAHSWLSEGSAQLSPADSDPQPTRSFVAPIPRFVPRRYRPGNIGNWSGHLAFANDLIAAMKPSLIVELGTHWGESFFTFCQSVFENGLDCTCYAVDHWKGEEHAGFYVDDVFKEVQTYTESQYPGIAYLLRTNFDDAVHQFANDSIDLLHIDGLHTFETVAHDFATWWPKVKPGGIVLLHDIIARHADFGVWRVWQDLEAEYPETFAFHHSWGLGVLRKPVSKDVPQVSAPFLDYLFHAGALDAERLRRYYTLYASSLAAMLHVETPAHPVLFQLFPATPSGYTPLNCLSQYITSDRWETLSFTLPSASEASPLRIDPGEEYAVVQIKSATVANAESRDVLWAGQKVTDFNQARVAGTAALIGSYEGTFTVLSFGPDPQIILPDFDNAGAVPLTVQLTVRVSSAQNAVYAAIAQHLAASSGSAPELESSFAAPLPGRSSEQLESAEQRARSAEQQLESTREQLRLAEQQILQMGRDLSLGGEEREVLKEQNRAVSREVEALKQLLETGKQDTALLRTQLEEAHRHLNAKAEQVDDSRNALRAANQSASQARYDLGLARTRIAELEQELESETKALRAQLAHSQTVLAQTEKTLAGVLTSVSWKATKPARAITALLRGGSPRGS